MTTHEIITTRDCLPVFFNIVSVNSHIVPNHWHTHVELLFMECGRLNMFCKEQSYALEEQDMFLVNSGDVHYTKTMKNTSYLLLQIPGSLLEQSIPDFSTLRFREYFSHREMHQNPDFLQIEKQLSSMKALFETKKEGYQFLFTSHLHLLLYQLYTRYSSRLPSVSSKRESTNTTRIKEIITYVEDHYAEPLSLSDTASRFALNPEYFCRYFKKNMGLSFLEHVNSIRLTHIYQDLLNTEESITQLQERHGFTNYKVFNRMFKETYGCSPSRLRAEFRRQQNPPA